MAITLEVKKREVIGRKAKNLRKEKVVPAELYGPEMENIHLSVPQGDFIRCYKKAGKNTIVELEVDGETIPTLIYNVQIHPITQQPLNIDFYKISKDTKIQTEVPINFTGTAPAEKEGLIIVKILDELEIEALPQNIPHEIIVDISHLKSTEDHIYVKDIKTPDNVDVLTSEENAVVTVSEKEEEIIEEPETPLAEELEEETEEETEKENSPEEDSGEEPEK